jgi:hypothetical protein
VLPLSYIYNSGRHYVQKPVPDLLEVLAWFQGIINGQLRDMMNDLLDEVSASQFLMCHY